MVHKSDVHVHPSSFERKQKDHSYEHVTWCNLYDGALVLIVGHPFYYPGCMPFARLKALDACEGVDESELTPGILKKLLELNK